MAFPAVVVLVSFCHLSLIERENRIKLRKALVVIQEFRMEGDPKDLEFLMLYNHEDKNHRLYLAGRVLHVLKTAGFEEETEAHDGCLERVFSREVTVKNPETGEEVGTPVRVVVYTSIDLRSSEIRKVAKDAIRICGVRSYTNGTERGCIKRKRVNRVGLVADIEARMLDRMRSAYVEARTAYRNPTYCKACGAMEFVTKAGKGCCSDLCWTKKAGYTPKPTKTYRPYRKRRYGGSRGYRR